MIWNSKIKLGIKKKKRVEKSNILAVGDERASPSVRPREECEEQRREERFCLNPHVFFKMDVRNWDSGGIADVPGRGALQTRDTHTNAGMQTRTNTHLHTKRLGRPWGSPLSNDTAANLHTSDLEFIEKGGICMKRSGGEKLQVAPLFFFFFGRVPHRHAPPGR